MFTQQTTNLTTGNITKQLIFLSLPLILVNIFQQFYNTIDAVIIGRFVNENAFAGIGVASTVMNLFIFAISGCCTGISIMLAQFFGAKNLKRFRQEYFISLSFGLLFTLLVTFIGILTLPWILEIIQTPVEIYDYTYDYLFIITLGLSATFLANFYNALLRAIGNTVVPLIFFGSSILINLFLDLLFIAVLDYGVTGAGVATVIAQLLMAVLSYVYLPIVLVKNFT